MDRREDFEERDDVEAKEIEGVAGTVYLIEEKKVSLSSVQAFVSSYLEFVNPESLYFWVLDLPDDAVIKVTGSKKEISSMDLIEEIDDAMEYSNIDVSLFE